MLWWDPKFLNCSDLALEESISYGSYKSINQDYRFLLSRLTGHSSNHTSFKPIFLRMIVVVRVSVSWNSYLGQAEIIGKKDSFGLRTATTALFISGTRLNGKKA